MKLLLYIPGLLLSTVLMAQPHPHGTVYGTKPGTIGKMPAAKLENAMGKRTRISTVITGRVINVTKTKGGWFTVDAGNGKTIAAHFKNMGMNLPAGLKGKTVTVEGIAQKEFIADDMQHFAGDEGKQHTAKTNSKPNITFEVTGLMVE